MRPSTSPLEHLTAFSIVFTAGILSAASFFAYIAHVRRKAVLNQCMNTGSKANMPASPATHRSIDE
jgi:hypothetical protein